MVRTGQRVDASFSSHYYSFAKVDENVDPAKFRRLCSAFPHLGFGVPCWCGWAGPALGVSPAGLLVCALGKYLDPAGDRDRCGPQNTAYGVLKFPGTVLVACRRKGSRVTWRLAVQFKMCSHKASWTKRTIGVCGWEVTSVVTLARFGLTTGFLLGPADNRRVSPSLLSRSRFF